MMEMDGARKTDNMTMTGDVDHDFAMNIRTHMQMAHDLAQAQVKNGKSPKLVAMARDVVMRNKRNITSIDQWMNANKKSMGETAAGRN